MVLFICLLKWWKCDNTSDSGGFFFFFEGFIFQKINVCEIYNLIFFGCDESNTKIYKPSLWLINEFMSFCNVTEPAVLANELS